jgi:hypothetical protein
MNLRRVAVWGVLVCVAVLLVSSVVRNGSELAFVAPDLEQGAV